MVQCKIKGCSKKAFSNSPCRGGCCYEHCPCPSKRLAWNNDGRRRSRSIVRRKSRKRSTVRQRSPRRR